MVVCASYFNPHLAHVAQRGLGVPAPLGLVAVPPAGDVEEVEEAKEQHIFKHKAISAQNPCAQCPATGHKRRRGLSMYNAFSNNKEWLCQACFDK